MGERAKGGAGQGGDIRELGMKPFKEFHTDRVGRWPGYPFDYYDNIFAELCESVAEYVDAAIKEHNGKPHLAKPEKIKK